MPSRSARVIGDKVTWLPVKVGVKRQASLEVLCSLT